VVVFGVGNSGLQNFFHITSHTFAAEIKVNKSFARAFLPRIISATRFSLYGLESIYFENGSRFVLGYPSFVLRLSHDSLPNPYPVLLIRFFIDQP
jgi:hypothetical protein